MYQGESNKVRVCMGVSFVSCSPRESNSQASETEGHSGLSRACLPFHQTSVWVFVYLCCPRDSNPQEFPHSWYLFGSFLWFEVCWFSDERSTSRRLQPALRLTREGKQQAPVSPVSLVTSGYSRRS